LWGGRTYRGLPPCGEGGEMMVHRLAYKLEKVMTFMQDKIIKIYPCHYGKDATDVGVCMIYTDTRYKEMIGKWSKEYRGENIYEVFTKAYNEAK
jgi:Zn-finger protein